MSYSAMVGGYLTVEPPLEWGDIRDSRFYLKNKGSVRNEPDVILRVDSEEIETDQGFTTNLTCKFAIPYRDSAYDCRDLAEHVESLRAEMGKLGRTVTGEMVVQPLDYGDGGIWRVVSDADGVRKEFAKLQWPDGSEVELP